MRHLGICLMLFLVVALMASSSVGQTIDPAFRQAALIKAKDFPGVWPDSVGPIRIVPNTDVNKNGKKEFFTLMDLATSYTGTTNVWILWFEATGNDTYSLLWSGHPPGRNLSFYAWPSMSIADLDNDGNEEILIGVPRGRTSTDSDAVKLFIYEYDPILGNFPSEPTMFSDLGIVGRRYSVTSLYGGDFDGDGESEIVFTSRRDDFGGVSDGGRTTLIYRLLGEVGPFSSLEMEWADSGSTTKGGYVLGSGVVDYDRDGKQEIWVPTWDMLSLAIYEAAGKDTYVLQSDINQALGDDIGEHNGFRFYDANGDGKLEMYLAGMSGVGSPPSAVYSIGASDDVATLTVADVYRAGPFVDAIGYNCFYDAVGGFCGADVGDLDGDGKMDFICGTSGWGENSTVFRMEYQGGALNDPASYSWASAYVVDPSKTLAYFDQVAIGNDLDGDGKAEILIGNLVLQPGGDDAAVIILEYVGTSDVSDPSGVPGSFRLEQNYPNPFNPTTVVSFQLPVASEVRLSVYDLLGREVATLVNAQKPAGYHNVRFDAVSLPTGAYYYRLQARPTDGGQARGFTDMKKMMVVK